MKRRRFWFRAVWSRLRTPGTTSGKSCFLTFWRPHALEPGGWVANDKPAIDALKTIFEHSSP
jgi:hypothetical protein